MQFRIEILHLRGLALRTTTPAREGASTSIQNYFVLNKCTPCGACHHQRVGFQPSPTPADDEHSIATKGKAKPALTAGES